MAGRGTDIVLGGKPDERPAEEWQAEHDHVVEAGGLQIIGTERHESRRIDNQLRGRAGRQGDPGSSRFYVSFEDDIMRRFAPDWLPGMMARLGMEEDMPHRERLGQPRARDGADEGRRPQLRHPQARRRLRRRDEHAARRHLQGAPQDARGRRPQEQHPGHGARGADGDRRRQHARQRRRRLGPRRADRTK